MSKKEEIIRLFNNGVQDKEIADRIETSLKYIRQVLKDKREPSISDETNKGNIDKSEIDRINKDTNELKLRVEELERIIRYIINDKEGKAADKKEDVIVKLEEVESFIKNIKKNYRYIKDFKVKFTMDWDNSFNEKDENAIDDKPSFNPIAFYRKEGEKKLKEKLSYLSNEELIQIIKEYVSDHKGETCKWKNKDKLVQYILERVKNFAESSKVLYT
ncbi:hypothetical protein [Clostridium aciditolerans]|uniref:Uncharacterized protein n=1 Tax=Clostridium aciditolerans TaxID=339861 RepID=A0A934HWZ9_9CLOT|nr:hypothetical protein [Clostridium aciditolerans]MBI6874848.1 hypothetical protein [Clostridium aciditolerans]